MRINNVMQLCKTLDWIPVVSTIAQLVHLVAKISLKNRLKTAYDDYLREYSWGEKLALSCPIVNIFYKIFDSVDNLRN
jgi:hypothetical protein